MDRQVSRRDFLSAAGGLGAGIGASSFLPGRQLWAQDAAAGDSGAGNRIDVHHHMVPTTYARSERDRILAVADSALANRIFNWKPEKAVEEMDRNGVSAAITSLSTPGIWTGDRQKARRLARDCNEFAARMVRDYPGRFGMFATLPLPDADGSLEEIEYAADVLRVDGFGLLTSYEDKWPGDPAHQPVFEELNRRKAVVYIHPTAPRCCRNLIPEVGPAVAEFLFDTTRAITSLLFSGTLSRFPDIRYIFPHAGGTMPVLAGRIAGYVRRHTELADKVPNGALYELKRLYFDVAQSVNAPAMAALQSLVSTEQILFGSDYPYMDIEITAGALDRFELSGKQRRAIHRTNAARLFPRLG